jgi:hypothetical protein
MSTLVLSYTIYIMAMFDRPPTTLEEPTSAPLQQYVSCHGRLNFARADNTADSTHMMIMEELS